MTGKIDKKKIMEESETITKFRNDIYKMMQKEIIRFTTPLKFEISELNKELIKYKRAFEILKDKGIFEFKDYTNMIFLKPEDYIWNGDIIEEMFINVNDEEYELLEGLINNESR